jgi:MBG domain (YGX type)/Bacterial Ig-like domain (group 3)/YDG domain
VGGQSAGTDLNSAELYIPWQKAFQSTGAMATPRSDATGAALTKVDGNLLIAGGSSSSAELYGFATVKTDASDYTPGSTVTITGTGWKPGETVNLTFRELPNIDTPGPYTAVADGNGNILDTEFAPDVLDVNVRFYLTAVGSQSGLQAQNTFTDARLSFVTTAFVVPLNTCSPMIQIEHSSTASVSVTLSTSSSGGKFYSDSTCSTQITTITTSASTPSSATLYYQDGASGSQTITITDTVAPHGDSATQTETIGGTQTGTTLALAALTPSAVDFQSGASITLSATLKTSGGATIQHETVSFFVDGLSAGSANTGSSGTATLSYSTSGLSIGSHTVQAIFEGDNSSPKYSASTSALQTLTVNKRTTTTLVSSCTPAPVNVGSATNCTATVTDNDTGTTIGPTGSVSFTTSGSGTFGPPPSCTLGTPTGASASCSVSYTPTAFGTGTHTITGSYGGDTTHLTSTSPGFNLTVINPATTTSVSSSKNPSTYGDSVTFTATVTPNSGSTTPIGSVAFVIDAGSPAAGTASACPGGSPANSLCATYSTSALTVSGSPHTVTANYTHTGNFADSSGTLSGGQVVHPAPLTITANAQSKQYGQADPTLTYTTAGFQFSDTPATVLTGTLARAAGEGVAGSPYAITQGTLVSNANYTIAFTGNSLTITPAPLTITANAQTKQYGQADPTLTYTTAGFQFSDTPATVLTGTLARAAGEGVAGSPYAITQGTLVSNANYTIAFTGSMLTITPAQLSVTANPETKQYGDADPTLAYDASGFKFTDTAATVLTGALTRAAGQNVGSYAITQGTLVSNANYTIAFTGNSLTVTPRPITVTAVASNRVYDGSTVSSSIPTITSGSLAYTDANGFTESYDNKNVGTGKTMTPAGAVNDGNGGNNYTVTSIPANLGTITQRPITVTAIAQTKVYGTPDPTLTYGVTSIYIPPIVSGDGLTGALSRDPGENVVTSPYAIHLGTLTAGTNYSITFVGANLTITQAVSKVVVSTSLTPSTLNQSVTFTATVSDNSPGSTGTPTGSVSFYLDSTGGTLLGTTTLSSGVGSTATTAVPVNSHSIIAAYGGDGNFVGSNGSVTQLVQYATGGICYGDSGHTILQPINADGTSVFKQGSTVPNKFRVCDALGNSIGTSGVITNFVLYQINAGTMAPIDETLDNSTNDLGWRFDPTAQQWIFNMSTKVAPANIANRTYYFKIALNDGSNILFDFGLK